MIFSQTETKRERMKKTMSKMRESKIDLHILIASAVIIIIIINYYFVLFKIKKRREEKKHFKHCCDIQARSDYICEIF